MKCEGKGESSIQRPRDWCFNTRSLLPTVVTKRLAKYLKMLLDME